MHILWINENANFMGGAESYIYKTVLELNSRGVKSSVLYSVEPATDPKWTSAFSEAYPLVDLQRQIDGLKPDIIYLHRWPGDDAIDYLLNCGIPVVRFIHDMEIFSTSETGLTTFGRRGSMAPGDYRFYYPLLARLIQLKKWLSYKKDLVGIGNRSRHQSLRCHGLVVASEYMHAHLVAHGCPESKILVDPLFVKEPGPLNEVPREKNHLLFVGQLVRGKGLDLVLQAMALLDATVTLTVCGDGKQKGELERLGEHLGLAGRVNFTGHVSTEDLHNHYKRATCLVVPSRVPETFCLTGPEAMMVKTPVVASRLGGMGEWQEGGAVINFKENDYYSLKEAIERILGDEALRNETAMRGYELCRQKLQANKHIDKLLDFMSQKIHNTQAGQ